MDPSIVKQMRCPECGSPLDLGATELRCRGGGHCFPIVDGIPRFVPSDDYTGSFSIEWTRHSRTQLDSANHWHHTEDEFRGSWPFPADELAGKLVLDAGCGMGRFAEIALKMGARVVGVDMSYAVDVARRNLQSDRFHPIQGDLTRLPFAPGTFDYIYSFGVLHHTPNPRLTFERLVPALKPGGGFSVNIYSDYNRQHVEFTKFYRKLVKAIGPRAFWYVCYGLAGLRLFCGYAPLRKALLAAAPLRLGWSYQWTHLDTFDWYTPTFMSFHNHAEVDGWYHDAGLVDLRVVAGQVGFFGRMPSAAR